MAEEALDTSRGAANGLEVAGKIPPNIIVLDGGEARAKTMRPATLSAEEAEGMGHAEPDPETDAAVKRLRTSRLGYCALKRLFDIVFSMFIIVCFSWLYLITAIVI